MKAIELGEICHFEKGNTGLAKATPGIYPLVTTGSERRTCNSYQFDTKAVCIPLVSSTGHGHASLKNIHYQEGKFALGSILVALTAKDESQLDIQYLHLYLSELKDQILVPLMSGAANVALSISKIRSIKIPLPSISRQRKIVQNYNVIKHEDANLTLEFLDQLALLKKLRQSILQEAISGKLTERWRILNPDIEPATKLLIRIADEKYKLLKLKNTQKKQTAINSCNLKQPVLPKGWVLTTLSNCTINKDEFRIPVTKSDRDKRDKVYDYYGASGVIDKIDGYTHKGKHLLIGEDGANLIARSTPIAFFADGKFWVNNHAHVLSSIDDITLEYLHFHINAIDLKPYITGGFQPKLSQNNLNNILINLPPLEEQHAIVIKVMQIFSICDQLEMQMTLNKNRADQLLGTVLKELFSQSDNVFSEPGKMSAYA